MGKRLPDSPCLGFSAGEGTTFLNNRPLGWIPYFLCREHTGFELLSGSGTLHCPTGMVL